MTKRQLKTLDKEVEMHCMMKADPFLYIHYAYGLRQQKVLPQYKELLDSCRKDQQLLPMKIWMFEPFKKGEMITWQQGEIVQSVKDALRGKGPNKIALKSGVGPGKTAVIAMLTPWFTKHFEGGLGVLIAAGLSQLEDGILKNIGEWYDKMKSYNPKESECFIKTSYSFKLKGNEDFQYSRAIAAKKENPETIAGKHAPSIWQVADEASGIDDIIFEKLRGIHTSVDKTVHPDTRWLNEEGEEIIIPGAGHPKKTFIVQLLVSQPTRATGEFYEIFHDTLIGEQWYKISLNTEETPDEIVSREASVDYRLLKCKGDKDHDNYRVYVKGDFPKFEGADDKGWLPLVDFSKISQIADQPFIGKCIMGVDPAGQGADEAVWVIRDAFKAKVVHKEKKSDGKSIAHQTLQLMKQYDIKEKDVFIDSVGVGVECIAELALAGIRARRINVGNEGKKKDLYTNLRAELHWDMRKWLHGGGELVQHDGWNDFKMLKRQHALGMGHKIKIMPKKDMKKEFGKSPDNSDALMLTFNTKIEPPDLTKTNKMWHNKISGKMEMVNKKAGSFGINVRND